MGVKAEVEKSRRQGGLSGETLDVEMGDGDEDVDESRGKGEEGWLDVAIEIPGTRDDDALPVFLAAMLTEALLADGELKDRLWMNSRFHWRLYVDVRDHPQRRLSAFWRDTCVLTGKFSRSSSSPNRSRTLYLSSPSRRTSRSSPRASRL